jgi:hypothetical protein
MIRYDYEYDLVNHPYLSEFFDQNCGRITQSISIPTEVESIQGFRIKLSRHGNPGPIEYQIGSSPSGSQLAKGFLEPQQVLPVFETWVGDDFNPVSVQDLDNIYLSLRVISGEQPIESYRIYGPNTCADSGGDANIKLPYWWYARGDWLDDLVIPLPTTYSGAALPDYPGGSRKDNNGEKKWSLSFCVLTGTGNCPEFGEQRFDFVRSLLAEPYSEWKVPGLTQASSPKDSLLSDALHQQTDYVTFDLPWSLAPITDPSAKMGHAISELRSFCQAHFSWDLKDKTQARTISFHLNSSTEIPKGEESFVCNIEPEQIVIQARSPIGIQRGVYWLEDQLLANSSSSIGTGKYQGRYKYPLRMAPGIYPAPGYFQLQDALVWTPGYLWRFARGGYNAIFLQVNIEELVEDSLFFPEMNDPLAAVVIERVRRLTEMADEYGISLYLDLKTGYYKPFSEAVYERIPQLRSFPRHGNYPCSGQQITLDFYNETLKNLFQSAPKLKGLVVIYDTEGFYSCLVHNNIDECPYCKNHKIEDLASRLFETLLDGIHATRKDTELILWTYFCDEDWNYRVIENMPAEVTLMACYSQFTELERGGVRIRTDDYSLCSVEPGAYFLKIQKLAQKKGLNLVCKTEDAFGQEFVSTPYTPCLQQHQERWDRLASQNVAGCLSEYVHLGFMPGPCSDLMHENLRLIEKNGEPIFDTGIEKLRIVAQKNYGIDAADPVLQAWESFSQAIREDFPYTMGVCRYPGPLQSAVAQPFNLDPEIIIPRQWSRGYVKDLHWTKIKDSFLVDSDQSWDGNVVRRCLVDFASKYEDGLVKLELARKKVDAYHQKQLDLAYDVAHTQLLLISSLDHFIQFFTLREAYFEAPNEITRKAMLSVCRAEKQNAEKALGICERNSRIGFSCEGAGNVRGGLFTPKAIKTKLSGLLNTINSLDTSENAAINSK